MNRCFKAAPHKTLIPVTANIPKKDNLMPNNFTRDEDGVVIVKADTSMKKKLGAGKSLKSMLSEAVMEKAEKSMSANVPEMVNEIMSAMKVLKRVSAELKAGDPDPERINQIIEKSFEIKAKSGFCNYPMASSFSRFLYLFCEALVNVPLTAADINIISTCVTILSVIFERNFAGEGDNESLDDFFDESDISPFSGL